MRLPAILCCALGIGALTATARADADSLNDNLGPREIAVGEAARGDARGAMAITLNPAGLALSHELVFEGGFGYRPGDGAQVASVSACDSTVPVPGCFYYRYFKAAPTIGAADFNRRSHEAGVTLARRIGPRVSVGVTNRYFDYNSDLAGEEDVSGWGADLGVSLAASSLLSVGMAGYNVLSADSENYPRGLGAGVTLRPSPRFMLAVDGMWNLETGDDKASGRYGGGGELFLQGSDLQVGYPLRLGGVYDVGEKAGYITAGIGYNALKVGIDLGLRKQLSGERMDGTSELMIQASVRVFGPRVADQQSSSQF